MRLSVKVKPKAREDRVVRVDGSHFKVWVKAAAERGRANQAVIEVLSEYLNVPKSSLSMISGHTSSQKIVEVNK